MTMQTRKERLMTGRPARVKKTATTRSTTTATPRKTQRSVRTRTCPVCAETFEASRSDQKYCSPLHRWYANGRIPKDLEAQAQALRDKRTERNRKSREKRRLERERKERVKLREMIRKTGCDPSYSCMEHTDPEEGSPMFFEMRRLRAEERYCG